jgi:hypothetical protein
VAEIGSATVAYTIIGGEIVYDATSTLVSV